MTGYGYGLTVSRDVGVAQSALVEGLQLIREVMATAIQDDGGVPRTRRRPPRTNEAPGIRHAPGAAVPSANTRPDGRVAAPGRVSPESGSPDSGGGADPGGADPDGADPDGADPDGADPDGADPDGADPDGADPDAGDTIAIRTAEPETRIGGSGGPPTGYPDQPHPEHTDPEHATAAVRSLVERVQAGETEAFGLIYDRYFDAVFRFVYFRVGNRQLAEDLTADTFLRALGRIASFSWQGRDLGAWLVTIARNLVADHFKSGRCRLEVTTGDVIDTGRDDRAPDGSPESAVVEHITNVELLKAVKQLNPEQRECVVLRFLQGLSVAETARVMGKNDGAIKALQYRAVRAIARSLPDWCQP